ncbi:MAG: chorismate mutase, partial [Alphaproteobacteria bacterium]|nr:chorismate mutase [Alphaproteobacteria bacterium]
IDRIDAAIQGLLVRRTRLVESVGALKKGDKVKIRPGREAEILYRLAARHRGPFPKPELMRIWREIIVATLSFEGPFSVAAFVPHGQGGVWDLTRDQYGTFTPIMRHDSAHGVIRAVANHHASVGVLPLPIPDDEDAWWPDMMDGAEKIFIVARLPFAGAGNARGQNPGALVIAPAMPDPTARDRACLGVETGGSVARQAMLRAFARARLGKPELICAEEAGNKNRVLWFADCKGRVEPDDKRLAALKQALDGAARRVLVLGAYAEALTAAELGGGRKRRVRRKAARK